MTAGQREKSGVDSTITAKKTRFGAGTFPNVARWIHLERLRACVSGGPVYMTEEPQPAVTTPAEIDFPWERVVVLIVGILAMAVAVMVADMLGYLPTPA